MLTLREEDSRKEAQNDFYNKQILDQKIQKNNMLVFVEYLPCQILLAMFVQFVSTVKVYTLITQHPIFFWNSLRRLLTLTQINLYQFLRIFPLSPNFWRQLYCISTYFSSSPLFGDSPTVLQRAYVTEICGVEPPGKKGLEMQYIYQVVGSVVDENIGLGRERRNNITQ